MMYNKYIKQSFDFKDLKSYLLQIQKTKKEETFRQLYQQDNEPTSKLSEHENLSTPGESETRNHNLNHRTTPPSPFGGSDLESSRVRCAK